MTRMHSAAPTIPLPFDSPTRPVPAHISIVPPVRPPMLRQASVAVMEGRAQSQAQVIALAQSEGLVSPAKNLALPRPIIGAPVAMMRSRSGSRVDSDGGVGLRDLLKVRSKSLVIMSETNMFRYQQIYLKCQTYCLRRLLQRQHLKSSSPRLHL